MASISSVMLCLTESPSSLPEKLEEEGWAFQEMQTENGAAWRGTDKPAIPGGEGEGLVLLGEELGVDGRRVSESELLEGGADVFAALETMAVRGSDEDVSISEVSRDLRDACDIVEGRLIASLDPVETVGRMTIHADAYGCTVRGEPCVWWSTFVRSVLGTSAHMWVSFGVSTLEYYASSQLIDASYDAVASMAGPWDIDASKEFRAMTVEERARLGLL